MSNTVTRTSTKISMMVTELEIEITELRAEVERQKHINAVLLEEHQRLTKELNIPDRLCQFIGGDCENFATCEACLSNSSGTKRWFACCAIHASLAMRGKVEFRNLSTEIILGM